MIELQLLAMVPHSYFLGAFLFPKQVLSLCPGEPAFGILCVIKFYIATRYQKSHRLEKLSLLAIFVFSSSFLNQPGHCRLWHPCLSMGLPSQLSPPTHNLRLTLTPTPQLKLQGSHGDHAPQLPITIEEGRAFFSHVFRHIFHKAFTHVCIMKAN